MKATYLALLLLLLAAQGTAAQAKKKRTAKVEASAKSTDFEQYKGHYASAENTDGILLYVEKSKLMGKIAQQPAMVFEHVGRDMFRCVKTGTAIEFTSDKKQLALKSKEGMEYLFKK